MNDQTETRTRLHGSCLLVARLAWTAVFLTLTVMYAFGFLAVRDTLSTVCEQEQCKLVRQIRHTDAGDKIMGWPGPSIGAAERLRPDQVQALEKLGLTPADWVKLRGVLAGASGADTDRVPEEYRPLVRAYFSALAKGEPTGEENRK